MPALIASATELRKAGLLGLFVWLAAMTVIAPGMAQVPSLLEQLQKGLPSAPSSPDVTPSRKSLLPPLRMQIEKAEVIFDQMTNEPVVVITLAPRSSRMFYELTLNHIGRALLLRIDGQVVAEPIIREPIKGGVVQISGNMAIQDAAALAERLSRGAAKVEVELVAN